MFLDAEVLPFEADGHLPSGPVPFLAFEWIGLENYLGEIGNRRRGANATSADFAFRFRRYDGRIELVLAEWKYTEVYPRTPAQPDSINETRLRVYRDLFGRWAGRQPDLPAYHTFFVEPFYQLMRLTLLAQEMERAPAQGRGEMGAEIVRVVHLAPKANLGFTENLSAVPALARFGRTIGAAWSYLAPAERFLSLSTESLLTAIALLAPKPLGTWRGYLWYLKESEETAVDEAESKREDAAAALLRAYMARWRKDHPDREGVHYSDLFERFVYGVRDKRRRPMADWLVGYFFKTEEGTWRPPATEEEERLKAESRAAGTNCRIKRYTALLAPGAGLPPDRVPGPATLAEWIRHAKRTGMYEAGRLLYERSDLDLSRLPEEVQVAVEEDYQVCLRALQRAAGGGERRTGSGARRAGGGKRGA